VAKPLIGICAALEHARYSVWEQVVHMLPAPYVEAVHAAGAMAVLLPVDASLVPEVDPLLDRIDGLLVAGGSDIDPTFYGATEIHPETAGMVPERDRFEIAMVRGAVERDMPALGICRGMQLINVALGGTLIQHVPDTVGHHDHRRTLGSFENADHVVRLQPGSLAARAAGEERHATKSHHHQAVDLLGDGLVASGWADDDLVEAIEAPEQQYLLGVQWHPEVDQESGVVASLVSATRARV
jgi:putative glutamine amidotransferase